MKIIIYIVLLLFMSNNFSGADTISMKGGERIKGVIVEEYKDRVVISTVDGEKEIMRDKIGNVIFDLEEQNLTSLGDFYQDRRMYKKAYYYYNKALEVNPNYKRAKDGLNYVGTYIQQSGRMRKLSHIQRLNEEGLAKKEIRTFGRSDAKSSLNNDLGFSLKTKEGAFVISGVALNSPAADAGVKNGDRLTALWGRAIGYMQPGEVEEKLNASGVMDVQLTVERSYMLEVVEGMGGYYDLLGIKLGFSEMEGLVVEEVAVGSAADIAGIQKGDFVVSVQGKTTRYMALDTIAKMITSRKGDTISLETKRDIVIWKKFRADK